MNKPTNSGLHSSYAKNRGAAIRAQRRKSDDAQAAINQYTESPGQDKKVTEPVKDHLNTLKVTFLGGLKDVGEKNMAVIEYQNQALIIDCGIDLSVDLPGINYTINDFGYLETIKHKIKAYVLTHGHLDHIGGLKHTVPKFPAPIYGSRYTIGVVQKSLEDDQLGLSDFKPDLVTIDIDNKNQTKIGVFGIEFVRVTHSLPDATAVAINTPVGTIVTTGDFRLDPEPLDKRPTDTKRLKEIGDKSVLLLMSDSSYADAPGRVQTESTLQQSFYDIIDVAKGRIFVATFSSNMNRTQMIINGAVAAGRKIALDGRGMLAYSEIAVRQGILKVPKGTIVPIQQATHIAPDKLLVMCTGGQGEPNAALQRMSSGDHRFVNLNAGDTVVISSSPIPGNEVSYDQLSNRLSRLGVHLYSHPTHEVDGCGPLHVSGHARRDELREMIQLIRPKFFIPIHAGTRRRRHHQELAIEEGLARKNILLAENGDSYAFTESSVESAGQVPSIPQLVDQNGSVVSGVVVKDRIMLGEEGIVAIILTVDRKSGQLLASPDIISRGFIAVKNNKQLIDELRGELRRVVSQRFKRVDMDRFKTEIRDHITHFLFERTQRSPLVITVVNIIGGNATAKTVHADKAEVEQRVEQNQKRFAEMRARLLGQDQRD